MQWVEHKQAGLSVPAPDLGLLERALAARPDNPALHDALGTALFSRHDHERAAAAYAEAERLDPAGFSNWGLFAAALLELGDAEAALALTDRGLELGARESLRHYRGLALRKLGRHDEAVADLMRALASGPGLFHTLKALLFPMTRDADGAPLLAACDALPDPYGATAGARACRAIALSRIGRIEEARALVDLDRHVAIRRFDPPPEFGGLEAFNRRLAEEIRHDPPPAPTRDGFEINYSPRPTTSPAVTALTAFTKTAIEEYLARLPEMGLADSMPVPERASLSRSTVVLHRDGTNAEHIHAFSLVSTVYYVEVPASVRDAEDDRGALLLGGCAETSGGYRACWGTRTIRPEPGMLVIFPAHFFHDVIPTRSDAPRIVVSADMEAAD